MTFAQPNFGMWRTYLGVIAGVAEEVRKTTKTYVFGKRNTGLKSKQNHLLLIFR